MTFPVKNGREVACRRDPLSPSHYPSVAREGLDFVTLESRNSYVTQLNNLTISTKREDILIKTHLNITISNLQQISPVTTYKSHPKLNHECLTRLTHTFYCLFLAELGQTFSFYPTRLPGETSPGFINDYIPSSFPTPGGRGWGVLQTRGQKGCVASAPLIQSGVERRESFHHQIMFLSSHLRVLAYCPVNSLRHPHPRSPVPAQKPLRQAVASCFLCRQINAFINMPFHSSRDCFSFQN